MIPCRDAERYVFAYLDGELEPRTEAELEAHLRACRRCLGEVEFQRRILMFVRLRGGSEDAPAGLRRRVVAAMGAPETG